MGTGYHGASSLGLFLLAWCGGVPVRVRSWPSFVNFNLHATLRLSALFAQKVFIAHTKSPGTGADYYKVASLGHYLLTTHNGVPVPVRFIPSTLNIPIFTQL